MIRHTASSSSTPQNTCDPIPSSELTLATDVTVNLAALGPGARGHVARVFDANPDMLHYRREQGVGVGDRVEVLDCQPFGDPVTVRLAARPLTRGDSLARAIRVELDDQSKPR